MNEKDKIHEERMQFIASIAHEIRIPLGGIISFSELLLIPNLSREKIFLYSNYVNTCSSRLLLLLNNLINSSKLESKQGIVVNGFIDLNMFIDECT
uniref:histidine kinase dimerization/phospho-acceptor domain-containing protein n=1 Tax=Marinifilum fragile TaxID=570161 RepID=UPI0006D0854C